MREDDVSGLVSELKNFGERLEPVERIYFFDHFVAKPSDYSLSKTERAEIRKIGVDEIPRTGIVLSFMDSEWYEEQTDEFKGRFPELDAETPSAIVERVEGVALKNSEGNVELKIGRYLIQEN